MEKTVCVVVTYHRKEELLKNLQAVFSQTEPPETIIIVDNYGKDGAREFAIENGVDEKRIEFIYPEKNIGGAGGFALGVSIAFERGFSWVILMDDDGWPWDENCFFELFLAVRNKGLTAEDKVFFNALVLANEEKLSFGLGKIEKTSELLEKEFFSGVVNPFNGTLISSGLIKAIGLPNGRFFIKGDEVDYENRAKRSGGIVGTVLRAKYYHPSVERKKTRWFGRTFYLYAEEPWKEYYAVRNYTYSVLQSGEKNAEKKAKLFFYKRLYSARKLAKNKALAKRMIRLGYRHGKKGILGGTVLP